MAAKKIHYRTCTVCGDVFVVPDRRTKRLYCPKAQCQSVRAKNQSSNLPAVTSESIARLNGAHAKSIASRLKNLQSPANKKKTRERKKAKLAAKKALQKEGRALKIAETKRRKKDRKYQRQCFLADMERGTTSYKQKTGVKGWVMRSLEGILALEEKAIKDNRRRFEALKPDQLPPMPPRTACRKDPTLLTDTPFRSYSENAFWENFPHETASVVYIETSNLPERWLPGVTPVGEVTAKVPDFRITGSFSVTASVTVVVDVTLEIGGCKGTLELLRKSYFRRTDPYTRLKLLTRARKEFIDLYINFFLRSFIFTQVHPDRRFSFMTPEEACDTGQFIGLYDWLNETADPQARATGLGKFLDELTDKYYQPHPWGKSFRPEPSHLAWFSKMKAPPSIYQEGPKDHTAKRGARKDAEGLRRVCFPVGVRPRPKFAASAGPLAPSQITWLL